MIISKIVNKDSNLHDEYNHNPRISKLVHNIRRKHHPQEITINTAKESEKRTNLEREKKARKARKIVD